MSDHEDKVADEGRVRLGALFVFGFHRDALAVLKRIDFVQQMILVLIFQQFLDFSDKSDCCTLSKVKFSEIVYGLVPLCVPVRWVRSFQN